MFKKRLPAGSDRRPFSVAPSCCRLEFGTASDAPKPPVVARTRARPKQPLIMKTSQSNTPTPAEDVTLSPSERRELQDLRRLAQGTISQSPRGDVTLAVEKERTTRHKWSIGALILCVLLVLLFRGDTKVLKPCLDYYVTNAQACNCTAGGVVLLALLKQFLPFVAYKFRPPPSDPGSDRQPGGFRS